MSKKYDEYLNEHREGVAKAFDFLRDNNILLGLLKDYDDAMYKADNNCHYEHDKSKDGPEEYDQYDNYFYGNKSYEVVNDFNYAWLHHIHNNPHHWQYWVLISDDEGTKPLEIPEEYVVEMICDWWSFSINKDNYYEIFDWYNEHSSKMILHNKTRRLIEKILDSIKGYLVSNSRN